MKFPWAAIIEVSKQSPPSRGAWIEIRENSGLNREAVVAPLAGGVD